MAKTLGADAPAVKTSSKKDSNIDLKRAINAGEPVTLSIGEFVVKEMQGSDFLIYILDSTEVVQNLFSDGEDTLSSIKAALRDPEKLGQLHKFFSLSMGTDADLSTLTLSDYVKLIVATRKAYDWETIQTGFTELGLTEMIQTFLSSSSKNESPSLNSATSL